MKRSITRLLYILLAFWVTGQCAIQGLTPGSENSANKQVNQQPLSGATVVPALGLSASSEPDDGLRNQVLQIYHLKEQCTLDILHGSPKSYLGVPINERPRLEFKNSNIDLKPPSFTVFEEVVNPTHQLRAFTGQAINSQNVNLYLEDQEKSFIQEIDWNRFIHSRPLNGIQWIEERMLLFAHSTGPQITEVGVIGFQEKDFVLYWLVDSQCK